MARRVRSLKDQMAELSNVAPDAELDPESDMDGYDAARNEADESEEDLEEEARDHARHNYADMAPSRLRKQANHLEGIDANQLQRYEGVKSSRKEMMSDNDDDEDDSGGESEEGDEEDKSGDDLQEEDSDSEDQEEALSDDRVEEDESITKPKTREKGRVRFEGSTKDFSSVSTLNAAQSDARLLYDLRRRSKEDAEKGRDARKQMDLWSKLLGIRIRGQKMVRGAGRISSRVIKTYLPDMDQADLEAYHSTLSTLDEMSSYLFLLQGHLLKSFTGSESNESSIISNPLSLLEEQLDQVSKFTKRPFDTVDDDNQHLSTLLKLDQGVFEPLWRDVLARWTSRTSTSSLDIGQKAKFESSLKAMNQSAEDQIDRGLTGETFERLRKRTRVWRGTEQEDRIRSSQAVEQGEDSEDEDKQEKEDADIFDDSDFYAAMLRELIDSRGGSSMMGTNDADSSLAWAQAAKRAAKKNKNTDLRSSKGRKLRYDIIEKVEHFMPPVPRETWSKDQVDRLFRQLRQANHPANDVDEKESNVNEGEKVELAGLRLFG